MNEEPNSFRLTKQGEKLGGNYIMVVDGIARGVVSADKIERLLEVDQRWEPMRRADNHPNYVRNPDLEEVNVQAGIQPSDEVWMNDLYQATLRYMVKEHANMPPPDGEGLIHISVHRHDRYPVGDWRHMQQIKNELTGDARWAMEIYPPEAQLVDSSNEYHLWVLPLGADIPFAYPEGLVTNDEQVEKYNSGRDEKYKGRQRPWQKGLTTGRNDATQPIDPETEKLMTQIALGKDRG